jgi:hypothetical protein
MAHHLHPLLANTLRALYPLFSTICCKSFLQLFVLGTCGIAKDVAKPQQPANPSPIKTQNFAKNNTLLCKNLFLH